MKTNVLLLVTAGAVGILGCGRASESPSAPARSTAPVAPATAIATASVSPSPAPARSGGIRLRELRWGDALPAAFRLLSQQSPSESAYFDPKEKLTVESVPVLDISYRFIDGRFSAMAIQGAPSNFPLLVEALRKKWGRPVEEEPGRVKWADAETTALAGLTDPQKPFVLIVIDNAAVARARSK